MLEELLYSGLFSRSENFCYFRDLPTKVRNSFNLTDDVISARGSVYRGRNFKDVVLQYCDFEATLSVYKRRGGPVMEKN